MGLAHKCGWDLLESSNCQESDLSFCAESSWETFWDLLLLTICLSSFTLKTQALSINYTGIEGKGNILQRIKDVLLILSLPKIFFLEVIEY